MAFDYSIQHCCTQLLKMLILNHYVYRSPNELAFPLLPFQCIDYSYKGLGPGRHILRHCKLISTMIYVSWKT